MNAVLFERERERDNEADEFIYGAEQNKKFLLADVMNTVNMNRLSCFLSPASICRRQIHVHFGQLVYAVIQDVTYGLMKTN
jgi:hypothetical protein